MATPTTQLQEAPKQNYAPIRPLIRLRDGSHKPNNKISDALKELFQAKERSVRAPMNEIISAGVLINNMCEGNQIATRNPYNGSMAIIPVNRHDSSQPMAMNFLQFFRQNLIEKWEESNPDILIRPGRNVDQATIAAKGASVIWSQYSKRYYNSWFSQQQCILAHSFGTYVDEIRYDDQEKSLSVIADVFEQKQVSMGDGYGFCPDCDLMGTAKQFQPLAEPAGQMTPAKCLECGSESAQVELPAQGNIQSATGTKEESKGELVCRQVPLPALKWDLTKRLEESSWMIRRQRVPRGAITRLLGNIAIPGSDRDTDYGLDVITAAGYKGQAMYGSNGGWGGGNLGEELKKNQITFDEMYLSPEDYADINLTGNEETVSGNTIPQGKLVDMFPNGICVTGLNGMSVILGIYEEKHKDHFVSGAWFMRAMTGAGRGIADSVEVQKRFNAFDAQQANYWGSMGTPAVFYDKNAIPGSRLKYLGSPRVNVPVDLKNLPDTRKLADLIHQFQPSSVPAGMVQYTQEFLNKAFQYTTMVTSFQNGAPGITGNNETATAATIDESNADAINGPIFGLKGEVVKREAEITIEQYRKHFPMGRFFQMGGKYGKQQGMMVYGADLESDLTYEVAKGSHLPKGPYTQRQNLMSFFQTVQGPLGYVQLKQADPKLADETRQAWDIDIDAEEFDDVTELCRKRLEQMKQAEQAGVTESEALVEAVNPPVSEVEPNLAQKSKWFAAALDQDDLQEASPALRGACELMAKGQFNKDMIQQAAMMAAQGIIQAAGAAPGALAEQAMNPPQEEQPPTVDPNQEMKVQADQQNQQMSAQEAEKARMHEAEQSAEQRKHELKTKQLDVKIKGDDNKVKLQIAKSRPKVGAKK